MIRRLVPYPLLAASLFVMWLLLAQSASPAQLVLALIVSLIATWGMTYVQPVRSRVRSWKKVVHLTAIVIVDIMRSNLAVARIVVFGSRHRISSFVRLPLTLRDPNALAVLGLIITATPGTAWVQFDRSSGVLLIHVFDLIDEDEWRELIKNRYEALLIEIFEA